FAGILRQGAMRAQAEPQRDRGDVDDDQERRDAEGGPPHADSGRRAGLSMSPRVSELDSSMRSRLSWTYAWSWFAYSRGVTRPSSACFNRLRRSVRVSWSGPAVQNWL